MAPRSASEKVRPKNSYFSSACEYVKLPFTLRVSKKIFSFYLTKIEADIDSETDLLKMTKKSEWKFFVETLYERSKLYSKQFFLIISFHISNVKQNSDNWAFSRNSSWLGLQLTVELSPKKMHP
jgi:hypothetical protein